MWVSTTAVAVVRRSRTLPKEMHVTLKLSVNEFRPVGRTNPEAPHQPLFMVADSFVVVVKSNAQSAPSRYPEMSTQTFRSPVLLRSEPNPKRSRDDRLIQTIQVGESFPDGCDVRFCAVWKVFE
jgi:hypothetical protein